MNELLKMPIPHLSAISVEKTYRKGHEKVPVLKGVRVDINRGEFLSIIGQSGSGKSTLLHLMGLLDSPDVGEIQLNGDRIDDLSATIRDQLRNRVFGFIFQAYHLLPELNLLENVLSPLMVREGIFSYMKKRKALREQACALIDRVGLSHRLKHRPSELSGGEMQRAAIARSLVGQPEILLADEPTGNLDNATGDGIMELLKELNSEQSLTVIMVTHNESIAAQADRTVRLSEGQIEVLGEAA